MTTIHITFTTPQPVDGSVAEEATLDVDRILVDDGRLQLLQEGEIRAELPISAVAEIDLSQGKTYSVDKIRAEHAQAYRPWDEAEEKRLLELADAGRSTAQIAAELGRQPGAIRSRLSKLRSGGK